MNKRRLSGSWKEKHKNLFKILYRADVVVHGIDENISAKVIKNAQMLQNIKFDSNLHKEHTLLRT